MIAGGFEKQVALVEEDKCPGCKEQVNLSDFKDPLSAREYTITGMCQKCQDNFFGEE